MSNRRHAMTALGHLLCGGCTALLILALAACEPPREVPTDPADPRDPALMEPPAPGATPEETERALMQGATQMSPNAAIANIDGWLTSLERHEFATRDQIIQGLRDLRTELQRSPLDGNRIASIMSDLGNWTTEAGAQQNNERVQRLGGVLSDQAERIRAGHTGAADMPPTPARPGDPGAAEQPEPAEAPEAQP